MSGEHPSSLALEAFACGEDAPAVEAHVATCDACRAFSAKLGEAQRAFAKDLDVDAVLRAAEARAGEAEPAEAAEPAEPAEPADLHDNVIPLARAKRAETEQDAADATAKAPALPPTTRGALLRVVPFVAMAAGVLLWMRLGGTDLAKPGAPTPPATATSTEARPEDTTGTSFKGGLQVAVIRERDGAQKRFTTEVSVRPGDRLRIEVALDHPQSIAAGVLADDGAFVELLHEGGRGAGTFYSEEAAHFDDSPTRGSILVGTKEAIAEARAARGRPGPAVSGVTTMRVLWEGP